MKTRIVLHSFDELSFVMIPSQGGNPGNQSTGNPVSARISQLAPPPSAAIPRAPAWLAAALTAHPPGDQLASSSPLNEL